MGRLAAGQAAGPLDGVDLPWYFAAGWALDLFMGGQRREHEDLEIAVPSSRFDELVEALPGFEILSSPAVPRRRRSSTRASNSRRRTRRGSGSRRPGRRWLADALEIVHPGHSWLLLVC